MSAQDRQLKVGSVGHGAGYVNLWMRPLWLKGDLLVPAVMSPKDARKLALRLLSSAEMAEEMDR